VIIPTCLSDRPGGQGECAEGAPPRRGLWWAPLASAWVQKRGSCPMTLGPVAGTSQTCTPCRRRARFPLEIHGDTVLPVRCSRPAHTTAPARARAPPKIRSRCSYLWLNGLYSLYYRATVPLSLVPVAVLDRLGIGYHPSCNHTLL